MSSEKLRVAVVMGGESAEREISLKSGMQVLQALESPRFVPVGIRINEKGQWSFMPPKGVPQLEALEEGWITPGRATDMLGMMRVDIVFIALHGPFGEDGTIQGMFELHHIPYTGSGVAASALAMEKSMTLAVLRQAGVPVAQGATLTRRDWSREGEAWLQSNVIQAIPGPWFVKPAAQGSSVGIQRVDAPEQLASAARVAMEFGNSVLIEQFCAGTEVTCAVLGNADSDLQALPPVEILPKKDSFFTYEEKYDAQGATEICPPKSVSAENISKIQDYAIRSHRAVGCDGMSRVDMIVGKDGIVVLEVNTIPGLTERSLLPKAAKAAGIEFPQLVERLIDLGLQRFGKKS